MYDTFQVTIRRHNYTEYYCVQLCKSTQNMMDGVFVSAKSIYLA